MVSWFSIFEGKKNFCSKDVSVVLFLFNPQTSKPETSLTTLLRIKSYTKFGQILVSIMPSNTNLFFYLLRTLETSSRSFHDFDKIAVKCGLSMFISWC